MNRRSYLRCSLATVASVFLFLQLGLVARNGCDVGRQQPPVVNCSSSDHARKGTQSQERSAIEALEKKRLALEAEQSRRAEELVESERQQFVDRISQRDVDRAASRIYGVPRDAPVFMTVGIPSIQRANVTYLEDTVASLSEHASPEDRKELIIVVLLSDFDEIARNATAKKLHKLFSSEISEGFLHVIKAPKSFYPDMNHLERTFNDPEKRVKWRSKQNLDYAYLMKYSQPLASYYMQLEDDVITVKGYLSRVKTHIQRMEKKHWSCLEFSRLGFIGKLFPSADVGRLAKFLITFFDQQPVDLLFPYFYRIMTQWKPLIMKPSLFQHMGARSSFDNNKNSLKDNAFAVAEKKYKGDNPLAEVYTNMETFEEHSVDQAYIVEDASLFFWGKTPKSGDYVVILFKKPEALKRLVVVTGSTEHPGDMLNDGLVEVGATVKNTESKGDSCGDLTEVGHFDRGVVDLTFSPDLVSFKVACIRITVKANQKTWLIVSEIAVFTQK